MEVFSLKLARTGSSVGLVLQICEWQFMQVLVGGILANPLVSTDVWQYRQSKPIPPTWWAWLKGTGCSRDCIARVVKSERLEVSSAQPAKASSPATNTRLILA